MMTREESRAPNALEKVSNKCRRQVAKRFGWKQNDYLNLKIPVYTEDDVVARWESTFNNIESDIAHFLSENPNPDSFCPAGRTSRLYELMMDIHSGNFNQAQEKIELSKTNHVGLFFEGPKGYDYEYIERWLKDHKR